MSDTGSVYDDKTSWSMINHIMDSFQFENVHKTMKAIDWHWSSTDGVPSLFNIKQKARKLLESVAFGRSGYEATGGLMAKRDECGNLSLLFYVDNCDANGQDLIHERSDHE